MFIRDEVRKLGIYNTRRSDERNTSTRTHDRPIAHGTADQRTVRLPRLVVRSISLRVSRQSQRTNHRVLRRQKGPTAGQMDIPAHLAVDQDESILVADVNNARVLLLTAWLRHSTTSENMYYDVTSPNGGAQSDFFCAQTNDAEFCTWQRQNGMERQSSPVNWLLSENSSGVGFVTGFNETLGIALFK